MGMKRLARGWYEEICAQCTGDMDEGDDMARQRTFAAKDVNSFGENALNSA
jgi:hypothetical protein